MKFDLKDMYNYLIPILSQCLIWSRNTIEFAMVFNIISKASIRCLSSRFLDHHIGIKEFEEETSIRLSEESNH